MCVGGVIYNVIVIYFYIFPSAPVERLVPPECLAVSDTAQNRLRLWGGGLGNHTVPRGLCMQILFTARYVTAFHITRWPVIGVIRKYDGH